jgi:hypothetical protein
MDAAAIIAMARQIGAGDSWDSGSTGGKEAGMARNSVWAGPFGAGRRLWVRPLAALIVLLSVTAGIVGTSGVAQAATSVTNVSVVMSNPSSAAGALTTYVVKFTTSTALNSSNSDYVSISVPTGTGLGSVGNTSSPLYDGSTFVGYCSEDTSSTVTCAVNYVSTVPGGDTLVATLNGVANPTAGSRSLTVSTSQDTTPVASPTYAVTSAQGVSGLGVSINTPTSAAGGLTSYVATFTTSSTGGLNGVTGSYVTLTVPSSTGLGSLTTSPLTDGATQVGSCNESTNTTVVCDITNGYTVDGGDTLVATLNGVLNPSGTGNKTLAVTTSSDTKSTTSPSYDVTADNGVSDLSVNIASPTSAASGLTTYVATFTTSSTGGLAGDSGSTVTLSLPTGTGLGPYANGTLYDGSSQVGECNVATTTTVNCPIDAGDSVDPGDTLVATLNGVVNPSTSGPHTLAVTTTSDGVATTSSSYSVTAAQGVSDVSVAIGSPSSAAGGLTSYVVTFTTSSTGALGQTQGSSVTLTLPTGTGLGSFQGGTLYDGSTQIGYCNQGSSTTVTCNTDYGSVDAGDSLVATLDGMVNPPTSGTYSLKISTSSDTASVSSPDYTVTAAQGVSGLSVAIGSPTSAAGGLTSYVATFTTSSTGGLNAGDGSTITLTVPAGTGISNVNYYDYSTIEDGGNSVGYCVNDGSTMLECYITGTVNSGDQLTITLDSVTNPSTAGGYSLKVSTSSDTTTVSSPDYTVTAAQGVSDPSVAIGTPTASAGGLTTYVDTFTTSSTGGLNGADGSTITLTLPTGTGISNVYSNNSTVSDGGDYVGYCEEDDSTTVVCYITGTVNAGDKLTVTLNGVVNPSTAGAKSLKVSTSSDTTSKSAAYTVNAASAVSAVTATVSKTLVSAGGVTYDVRFKAATGLDAAVGSTVKVTLPAGTSLASLGTSELKDGATQIGTCYEATSTVATCYLSGTAKAGSTLTVDLADVKNPGTTKAYTLAVTTSSDLKAGSATYCIATSTAPCVAHISPDPATVGTTVTITGVNLSGAKVTFNGKKATLTSDSATKIVTKVPKGATTGPVKVTTSGGTASVTLTV